MAINVQPQTKLYQKMEVSGLEVEESRSATVRGPLFNCFCLARSNAEIYSTRLLRRSVGSTEHSASRPAVHDNARYKMKREAQSKRRYTRNGCNFFYRETPAKNTSRVHVYVENGMKSRNADVQKSVQFYRRGFTFQIRTYPRRNRV